MNIAILMAAGVDNFFKEKNYSFPKPLVEINNKTIAQHVVNSIEPFIQRGDKIIFVVRKDDNDKYYLNKTLKLLAPNSIVISIPGQTAGGAISALLSIEEVNELDPLLIMNGDQIIEDDLLKLTNNFVNLDVDAGTLVFNSVHPRWSYIKCDEEGYVIEAAEKKPISNLATAGFYYYKIASDYFDSAKKMILKDSHVDGQFYVCPVFNEIVLNGKKIGVYKIEQNKYHSLMTEKMIKQYEEYLINLDFKK
jgi:NDP-sugar pyrophosphorylase family protein